MSRLTNKLANARAIFSLTFRNRYEARWIEALGTTNIDRFRHRSTVAIPVSGPLGLNRIKLSNEFFFSFLADSYDQNWLIPVLAEFRANKGWSFQLYYMIRSRRGSDGGGWTHSHVIGTSLRTSLKRKSKSVTSRMVSEPGDR